MEVKFSPIYLRQQPKSVDLRVMEEEEIDEKVDEKAEEEVEEEMEVYLGREPKSVEIREKKRSGAGARTFTNFSFIARGLFQTHIYNLVFGFFYFCQHFDCSRKKTHSVSPV